MALSACAGAPVTELAPSDQWWAVDKIITGYLIFTGALLIIWFRAIPDAWWLLALHVAALASLRAFRSNVTFHSWYPLPYVAACYKEMAILIPAVRGVDFDAWAARVDRSLWGGDPTAWLAHRQLPALTEFLQICYSLFIPMVLVVAWILWRQRKMAEFRFYALLIAMGFMASYLGYLAVPVRGPRFLAQGLPPLDGLWLTRILQHTLDKLESAHYDCFPSGHTELTILACWGSRMVSRKLHQLFWVYTPCIIFATVYLRYHYTIDVLAGALLAFVLIAAAPHVFTIFGKRGH
jgi:membrane-associated phospholipid phosphatase